jgi:hypothetical protein
LKHLLKREWDIKQVFTGLGRGRAHCKLEATVGARSDCLGRAERAYVTDKATRRKVHGGKGPLEQCKLSGCGHAGSEAVSASAKVTSLITLKALHKSEEYEWTDRQAAEVAVEV